MNRQTKKIIVTVLISNAVSMVGAMAFAEVTPSFKTEGIQGILLAALILQWSVAGLLWANQSSRIHTVSSYETLRTQSMIDRDTQPDEIGSDQRNFAFATLIALGSLPMCVIYAGLLIWV